MSPQIADATVNRIAEHVDAHRLPEIEVILHGGEPLLAGPGVIRRIVTGVRSAVGDRTRVAATLQTNGVLLDSRYLELFGELEVRVGVSLDGDEEAHDRNRRRADGRGSHRHVVEALRLLTKPEFRRVFGGLLCTIDLGNDPIRVYEALLEFDPPAIDFLLPHGNWTTPPPGRDPDGDATPYADWLITIFDRWYHADHDVPRVRLFEEILHLLLGGASATELVGLSPAAMIVVETDGAIEQSDLLKSVYDGAAATGLHVLRDSFDDALRLPAIAARQLGRAALAGRCRACPISAVCGGGLYVHRYRAGSGFANPSVYCPDLFRLITHIRSRVAADLAAAARDRSPRSADEPA